MKKLKKDLRIIKTEKNIRTALFSLLKTKSLEEITVSELCRTANVNRGTFYLHYGNIQDVFKQTFEEIVEDLKISYDEPYKQTNDNINQLDADMIRIFDHVKRHQSFYEIVFNERIPMTYYYSVFDRIRLLMSYSIEKEFTKVTNIDKGYLLSYQTNAILGLLIHWHRKNYETPVNELNQQLLKIINFPS
ncbi:TetR/AcrR family transcriptional regulator [Oceanobacillus sp. 1P07AA]|uniref:TetR/AcrR family transcriptional regulator n=1 Tax=Oceanobacillus sp. 1P07AA TaxID=3132293 RepID=UPI0039A58D1D